MTLNAEDFDELLRELATQRISSAMSVSETNLLVEIIMGAAKGSPLHDEARSLLTKWLASALEEHTK